MADSYFRQGHAVFLTEPATSVVTELTDGGRFYEDLPHSAVKKEGSTTTKTRVVLFSKTGNGKSLSGGPNIHP